MHAALKRHVARPGDELEVPVEGHVADIRRDDLLIEIQTRNFSGLRRKLTRLLEHHSVRMIHPVSAEKWITRVDGSGRPLGRRKSPRRGRLEDVFLELVSFPELAAHPRFSLEVLLIHEEEIRAPATNRLRWRRRKAWRTTGRCLLGIVGGELFATPQDYALRFLPESLPGPFTTRDLAGHLRVQDFLAQKMAYCLRRMGVLEVVGKRGRWVLYHSLGISSRFW